VSSTLYMSGTMRSTRLAHLVLELALVVVLLALLLPAPAEAFRSFPWSRIPLKARCWKLPVAFLEQGADPATRHLVEPAPSLALAPVPAPVLTPTPRPRPRPSFACAPVRCAGWLALCAFTARTALSKSAHLGGPRLQAPVRLASPTLGLSFPPRVRRASQPGRGAARGGGGQPHGRDPHSSGGGVARGEP